VGWGFCFAAAKIEALRIKSVLSPGVARTAPQYVFSVLSSSAQIPNWLLAKRGQKRRKERLLRAVRRKKSAGLGIYW